MYIANNKTKIGKRIEEKIENSDLYKDIFGKENVAFLTHIEDKQSDLNIHIYPEERMRHLRIENGRFGKKDIHIPGCISNFIIENIADLNHLMQDKLDLEVIFGRGAASSRKKEEYSEYPINSHIQLEEIKYLGSFQEVNLLHIYDGSNYLSKIKINGVEFEFDTVEVTAQFAIDSALYLIGENKF